MNRQLKMYGLKYKYIRIEDQQFNFEMDTMFVYLKYQIKPYKFKKINKKPPTIYC